MVAGQIDRVTGLLEARVLGPLARASLHELAVLDGPDGERSMVSTSARTFVREGML